MPATTKKKAAEKTEPKTQFEIAARLRAIVNERTANHTNIGPGPENAFARNTDAWYDEIASVVARAFMRIEEPQQRDMWTAAVDSAIRGSKQALKRERDAMRRDVLDQEAIDLIDRLKITESSPGVEKEATALRSIAAVYRNLITDDDPLGDGEEISQRFVISVREILKGAGYLADDS